MCANWDVFLRAVLALSLAAFLCSAAAVANAASTDATLSALSLKDRDGDTVALSPDFNAATTSYTASVPARTAWITIEATKNDDGAGVDYLDGAESELTDADAVKEGFQVDLAAGANTIKVKVTAEDTVNTATYTAVVTQAAPTASADALLSNLDESNDAGMTVGTPTDSPNDDFTQAIRFQTGSNERGYNITSVKAVLANASDLDGVRVRIFGARSIGTPYISFFTLTNPVIADGTLTFTAPASATLRKNAGYFVVFDSTASGAGNDYEIRGTESDFLNSQAVGWTLSEDRHARNTDSASWTTYSAVPLIEINGDAVVQATDANLSALRMRDGNGKLVTYSPYFDSSITSYATNASPKVDRITILGTASNDGGATVAYLDEDDQLLTDADAVKEGFQVDLEAGSNTINVRVTAEDGSTTRTYTMVVTRRASRVSELALASNLDEHFSKRLFVGNLEPGKILRVQALGFETGGNDAGYVLNSVKILIWELSSLAGVRVRIFSSTAEGNPDSSLYTLSGTVVLPTTDQGPEESARVSTFDAPANATLEPNTRYFLVLDSKFSQLYRYYKVWGTKSDDISKVADGWSMNNYRHTGIRNSGVWTTADEVPFVDVSGYAVVPSSDATLTDLGLTWDDGGTATDIALNPTFDASTTAYTASVANGVDRITIAGTKGDSGARVDYFDGA
ncbi:MAG: cadherin-like beta sandwich domain-containing protein, partial [Gammaproteobacteria bacterium]|nr:cadherin-like beta sandwich domain-containing protein [Gammaproteobacteria bacterium]